MEVDAAGAVVEADAEANEAGADADADAVHDDISLPGPRFGDGSQYSFEKGSIPVW